MNQGVEANVKLDLAGAKAEVEAALAAGEAAKARAILAEALKQWPKDHTLRIRQGEALQQLGALEDAAAAYLLFGREDAGSPWALLRGIRLLRDAGELERAREIFAAEVWIGSAPHDAKLRALGWLVTAADEGEPAATFLGRLADAAQPAPTAEALARLAQLRARQGRHDDARAALARISDQGAASSRARAVEADLLFGEGRSAELLALAASIAAEEPDNVQHARRLVGALLMNGDRSRASEALLDALGRWPGDWILLSRLAAIALPRDRIAERVEQVAMLTDVARLPEISRFWFSLCLLKLDRMEGALDLIRDIPEHTATGAMASPLRRVLELAPPHWWRSRSRLDDDRAAEVQIVRSAGARTALLVFGSLTGSYSHLPFRYLDALLADVCAHVVYLRDTSMYGYLRGIESLGADDEVTAAALRGIVTDLGVERVVGLGASIGGHAAARFGARIGMDAVALLSAPTTLDRAPIAGERESPYNRSYLKQKFAKDTSKGLVGADLVDLFAANLGFRCFYYYGAGTERGERNAGRLQGLANVELRPFAGPQTLLPLDIVTTDEWSKLLYEDLAIVP